MNSDSDEIIATVRAEIETVVSERGITSADASAISLLVACRVREKIGGGACWVPKQDKTLRNEHIKSDWNGHNAAAIMLLYGISRSTFYRIIGNQ